MHPLFAKPRAARRGKPTPKCEWVVEPVLAVKSDADQCASGNGLRVVSSNAPGPLTEHINRFGKYALRLEHATPRPDYNLTFNAASV